MSSSDDPYFKIMEDVYDAWVKAARSVEEYLDSLKNDIKECKVRIEYDETQIPRAESQLKLLKKHADEQRERIERIKNDIKELKGQARKGGRQ